MTHPSLLIFDMDGVLVDVADSYRAAISHTVEFFTGSPVPADLIQQFKNEGGWNDDWALSFRLIRDAGFEVGYGKVVDRFQKFFRGENGRPGLIECEKWIARDGLFDRLGGRHQLAVFTGRLHEEAGVTLRRFAPNVFHPVVGVDNVAAAKPAPDGILQILATVPDRRAVYIGDTVDDAASARAANVPFIGVCAPETPRRAETLQALLDHGAVAIVPTINELERELEHL